jgi:hypothetical protein
MGQQVLSTQGHWRALGDCKQGCKEEGSYLSRKTSDLELSNLHWKHDASVLFVCLVRSWLLLLCL